MMNFEPARPDLNGFKAIRERTCYDCGGPLGASFCERHVDTAKAAFAAAICIACKNKQREEEEKLNDMVNGKHQSGDTRERGNSRKRSRKTN